MLSVLFCALCLLLLALYPDMSKTARLVQNSLCMSACLVFAIVVAGLYVTQSYYNNVNTLHHFDAYYYPVFEVYHGRTSFMISTALRLLSLFYRAPIGADRRYQHIHFSLIMAALILIVNLCFFAVV